MYIDAGADISPDGLYRYRLWRLWDSMGTQYGMGKIVWVMLNRRLS